MRSADSANPASPVTPSTAVFMNSRRFFSSGVEAVAMKITGHKQQREALPLAAISWTGPASPCPTFALTSAVCPAAGARGIVAVGTCDVDSSTV